jgi:L-malate glycosyltransferase
LNILFVISSLKHGGAEKQTVIDANLFSANHNVFVITFNDGELSGLLNKKIKLFFLRKKNYPGTARKVREIILKENIQVVNASLIASMVISYLAARKTGVPVLWYFHSHEYDIRLKSRIALKYFAKSDIIKKIFFVSEELKKSFLDKNFNFPPDKLDIIYNSYTIDTGRKVRKENPENETVIGFIGRLVELKRVEYLIELSDYLKKTGFHNFSVEIVGDGESKQLLMEKSEELQTGDFVKFPGFKQNVEEYYSKFDIFVLPSREECLSISLIDACISALPCVPFRVGANDEIIINNKTGFLVDTKEEMFEKVQILLKDGKMRTEFGMEARKYCIDKFDSKKRINYLENIFLNLNQKTVQ